MSMAARKGRNRSAARARNGRATRAQPREDVRGIVIDQRSRFVPRDQALDQRAENPLGRYAMWNWISAVERDAGIQYARMVAGVKRDYGGKPDDAPSTYPSGLLPGASGRFDQEATQTPDEQRKARTGRLRRYNEAFTALQEAGRDASHLVTLVAVRERMIDKNDLPLLCCGLRALARHWGLTRA